MEDEGIEKLNLHEEIEEVLKKNNIYKIKELTNKTKKMLKEIGLVWMWNFWNRIKATARRIWFERKLLKRRLGGC